MDLAKDAVIIGGGILTLLGAVFVASRRFASLELAVKIIWDVMMQDSGGRLLAKGFAQIKSPPVATDKIIERFPAGLTHDLRSFYQQKCRGKSDSEASMAIAMHFRERLNAEVNRWCPELNLQDCIAAATLIAKIPDPKSDSDREHDTMLDDKPGR